LEPAIESERRHFTRVLFSAPAELVTTQQHVVARVLDLSLKGALLELPADSHATAGMPCLLRLPLNESGVHIAMAGEIAHVKDHRAGVLCRSIDLESITHLRRLVEMNMGDASLLERDFASLAGN